MEQILLQVMFLEVLEVHHLVQVQQVLQVQEDLVVVVELLK